MATCIWREHLNRRNCTTLGRCIKPLCHPSGSPDHRKRSFSNRGCGTVNSVTGQGAFFYVGDDNRPNDRSSALGMQAMIPCMFPSATSVHITYRAGTWFDGNPWSPWSLDTVMPTVSGPVYRKSGFGSPPSRSNIVHRVSGWNLLLDQDREREWHCRIQRGPRQRRWQIG